MTGLTVWSVEKYVAAHHKGLIYCLIDHWLLEQGRGVMYFGSVSNGRDSQDLSSPAQLSTGAEKAFLSLFFFLYVCSKSLIPLEKYIPAGLSYTWGGGGGCLGGLGGIKRPIVARELVVAIDNIVL